MDIDTTKTREKYQKTKRHFLGLDLEFLLNPKNIFICKRSNYGVFERCDSKPPKSSKNVQIE